MNFILKKGDKVAFLADNSLAVTRLFNILTSNEEADSGTFKFGITIHPSYLPSSLQEFENIEDNLIDYLRPYGKEDSDLYIRGYLGRMLFSGDEAKKKVEVLSGGEKVRLRFCRVMLDPGNLIILDDPTNHLDLESIESLNKAMSECKGVLLFYSHDRQLMKSIANRFIYIKNDLSIIDREMNYDEFEEFMYQKEGITI